MERGIRVSVNWPLPHEFLLAGRRKMEGSDMERMFQLRRRLREKMVNPGTLFETWYIYRINIKDI